VIFENYKKNPGVTQGIPTVPEDFWTKEPRSLGTPWTAVLVLTRELGLEILPSQSGGEIF
jgi:hypothetical protein